MAWDLGDIISVQFKQTYLGQQMVNKLFYEIYQKDALVNVENCFDTLATDIATSIATVQASSAQHYEQLFLDETNQVDIYVSSNIISGSATGVGLLPSMYAVNGKKNVATRLTRPGSIRIGGLYEDTVEQNGIPTSWLTVLDAVGFDLANPQAINDGGGLIMGFQPVVVGRLPNGAVDVTRFQSITSVANWKPSTQNSRKP